METKTSHVILYITFYVRFAILTKHKDERATLKFHFVQNATWPCLPISSKVQCWSDHGPVSTSFSYALGARSYDRREQYYVYLYCTMILNSDTTRCGRYQVFNDHETFCEIFQMFCKTDTQTDTWTDIQK